MDSNRPLGVAKRSRKPAPFSWLVAVAAALAMAAGPSASAGSPPADAGAAPPPKPIGTVTVTARRRADRDTIRTVIAPFVDQHAARDRKSGLLLRAAPEGICPQTLGISAPFSQFVTARIVAVAKSVGAVVQEIGKCRPNVEVVFSSNPQSLVDGLVKMTRGDILGFHYAHEDAALIRVSRPIQAWYVTGTFNEIGASNAKVAAGGAYAVPDMAVMDQVDAPDPFTGTGSHLTPRNSSQIVNVLILVDAEKVVDQEIGPIADYIAMLALSQAQSLDNCGKLPSILDLMSPACASRPRPQTLTESDMAFLKALYASDISAAGDARSRIADAMAKDLGPVQP